MYVHVVERGGVVHVCDLAMAYDHYRLGAVQDGETLIDGDNVYMYRK